MQYKLKILLMARISGKLDEQQQLLLLGEAIRQLRKQKQLSQEALAFAAQIDRSHMGKIERGERNVTLLSVIKIANALECKPSELLKNAGL